MAKQAGADLGDLLEFGAQLAALDDDEYATYLGGLTVDEMNLAEEALTAYEQDRVAGDWRDTPATMSHHLTNGRYKLWPYWRYLGVKFRQAVDGTSKRQIWNLPPAYGKSGMASRWGPAWALDRDPTTNLLLVSYGNDLAKENATELRTILNDHADDLRVDMRAGQAERMRFRTTRGGGVYAAALGGAITGFRADGIVFDDPHKDEAEAASKTARDRTDARFRSSVMLRITDDRSYVIVVSTRWHEDDLTGRLIKRMLSGDGEQWDVVRIPEIAEAPDPTHHDYVLRLPDPLGRAPGQVIEPERFSEEMVAGRLLSAGSYFAAGMHQQRPAPEEGSEIMRHWFGKIAQLPPRFDLEITSWDVKLKDNERGDWVVGQWWGKNGTALVLGDQLRGQWNQATTENAIALLAYRHPHVRAHYVENTGNGPEVMTSLRAGHPGYEVSDEVAAKLGMTGDEREAVSRMRRAGIGNLLPVTPRGPKPVRMRAVSGWIEGGSVSLPEYASWRGAYLDEMASFPNGADDQVDATSQALSKLIGGQATVSQPASLTLPRPPISTRGGGGPRVGGGSAQADAAAAAGRRSRNPARIVIPRGVPRSGR